MASMVTAKISILAGLVDVNVMEDALASGGVESAVVLEIGEH
jgi:hypothetical protein